MAFKVCAMYTFGKAVSGRAKVKVCRSRNICRTVIRTLASSGCANYTIYYDNVQNVVKNYNNTFSPGNMQQPRKYTFEATVFEEGTGVSVKAKDSPSVNIHDM